MESGHALGELAERVGGTVSGDPSRLIRGVATLDEAGPHDLAFLTNPRYRDAARTTRAGAILTAPGSGLAGRDLLEADAPYLALARILAIFHPETPPEPGISPDARVSPEAVLGGEVSIGPFAVIGPGTRVGRGAVVSALTVVGADCVVGDHTILMPRVVLYRGTRIGARCLIHAGVVLGADGFGFATVRGVHHKVPQVGRVVVEDDVEIGANSAVDRGALGDTVIGRGSKIDDLVMIAHGARLGEGCLLAAQAGISGSTRLGRGVVFAGQSGAAGHLELGDGAVVAAKTAVFADVPKQAFVAGIPATDHASWKRSQALVKRLPEMRAEVRDLRRRLEALEARVGPERKD